MIAEGKEKKADKPVIMFRTKADILTARDLKKVKEIDKAVLENPIFIQALMTDKMAFTLQSGSDFTVVDVQRVPDVESFIRFAFGEESK